MPSALRSANSNEKLEDEPTPIGSDTSTHWTTHNSAENVTKHNWADGIAIALVKREKNEAASIAVDIGNGTDEIP